MNDKDTALYKAIGIRIREARLSLGMSQAALSEKSYVSLPHISDVELGKKKLRLDTFIRIAEALQVSTDVLLRPNVPQVQSIYASELAEVLKDCTPAEADSLLKIVREVKATLKNPPDDSEY